MQTSCRNAASGATKTDREQTLSFNATESGLDVNGIGSVSALLLFASSRTSLSGTPYCLQRVTAAA